MHKDKGFGKILPHAGGTEEKFLRACNAIPQILYVKKDSGTLPLQRDFACYPIDGHSKSAVAFTVAIIDGNFFFAVDGIFLNA